MRPPVETIEAPPFPRAATWANTPGLQMVELRGGPVLIEFWDFCRPNSLRTLPYVKAWHERYGPLGLTVVTVHAPGFRASAGEQATRDAIVRLGIEHPVLLDLNFGLWQEYENAGWPGRYLWNADGMLADYHYGEGAYADTERLIAELLDVPCTPLTPLRPEDAPGAPLIVPSEDRIEEPWSGGYEAGAVWGVLDGRGVARANGREVEVTHPGAYLLVAHERHSTGDLHLELGRGVRCDGICFSPGLE